MQRATIMILCFEIAGTPFQNKLQRIITAKPAANIELRWLQAPSCHVSFVRKVVVGVEAVVAVVAAVAAVVVVVVVVAAAAAAAAAPGGGRIIVVAVFVVVLVAVVVV